VGGGGRELPSLGLDADTPDDLAALRASGRLGDSTASTLGRLGVP
jgi:hypothetical protein